MVRASGRRARGPQLCWSALAAVWVVACAVSVGAGCSRPATQLVVVVDSDLTVPSETVSVRARVRALERADAREPRTFALTGPGSLTLPFSFGVVPPDGDATRRVELVVEALDAAGEVVVSRLVRTGFVRNQSLRLPVFLATQCRDVLCAADLACERGTCVPAEVAPETLVPVRPGEELADASTGADAGSSVDAGPPSACTPVPTRVWLSLRGAVGAVALTARAAPRPEWLASAEDADALFVHAIGTDGTADRQVTRISVNRYTTAWAVLHPLPAPADAMLLRMLSGGVIEMRRSLLTEGATPTLELLVSDVNLPGSHVLATLDGGPVLVLDELPRMGALYRVPTAGPASPGIPIDLGTTMLAYRGSIASRADGGALLGRAAVGACELAPVSRAGSVGAFATVPYTGTCSAPAMAELADGRVAVFTTSGPAVVYVLSADLTRMEGMRELGPRSTASGEIVAAPDGSMRVAWVTDAGVATTTVEADPALTPGETVILTAPGASALDYGRVRAARLGAATAIVFSAPDALMLTVLCD